MQGPASFLRVTDAGAVGDGATDDCDALQRILDGGGRSVYFPAGIYTVSRPLRLPSGTRILADDAAVIRMADGAGVDGSVFLLTNADPDGGDADIVVEGGIWDSNCAHNPRGEEYGENTYSGVGLNFVKVRRLTLRNLTVRNPDCFYIRLGETEDFRVEDIRFDGSIVRPNQDGVHVGGYCSRGVIRRLRAITPYAPNDDMVALNADDDVERQMNRGMRRGPIRDIVVDGLHADSAYTFVRILSQNAPVEDVDIRGIFGGVRCDVLNMGRWRFPAGKGCIRRVRLRDCRVRKMPPGEFRGGGALAEPLVHMQLGIRDLRMENIVREAADEWESDTLRLEAGVAERIVAGGLTASQLDSFCDGRRPPADSVSERLAAGGRSVYDIDFRPDMTLRLAGGGVERFEINPED
jgi:hypothetical protein